MSNTTRIPIKIRDNEQIVEVYESEILVLVDEFIDRELAGISGKVKEHFLSLIFFIADRIEKPDNSNIQLLDGIFSTYTKLCAKYSVMPTLESFSFLIGVNRSTLTDWRNGEYRASTGHSITVKKWFDVCKSFVIHELSNSKNANINLIFSAKAAYGLRETSPTPAPEIYEHKRALSAEELPNLSVDGEQ